MSMQLTITRPSMMLGTTVTNMLTTLTIAPVTLVIARPSMVLAVEEVAI